MDSTPTKHSQSASGLSSCSRPPDDDEVVILDSTPVRPSPSANADRTDGSGSHNHRSTLNTNPSTAAAATATPSDTSMLDESDIDIIPGLLLLFYPIPNLERLKLLTISRVRC